jgi:hypothetical protein
MEFSANVGGAHVYWVPRHEVEMREVVQRRVAWPVFCSALLSAQIGYVKLVQSFPFPYQQSENLIVS